MTASPPAAAESFRSTRDADPYGFYARVREQGEVVWDAELNAWLVTSYAACKQLLRADKVLFRHPYSDIADDTLREIEGVRSRNLMLGDDHARHHRWFTHRFAASVVDGWRPTLIRPVAERLVDRFAGRGRAELAAELAEPYAIRVIAGVMGLPWEDDAFVDRCKALLDTKMRYLDAHGVDPDGSIAAAGVAAAREMNDIVMPFIDAARGREPVPEDILALLWHDGPSIMPDWGVVDMTSWVSGTFFAGTDTTSHAMANAVFLLLGVPGLQDELRAGGEPAVARFAEEVLRLYGSVHFRFRIANEDTELAGVPIRAGDFLYVLLVGANRDPERYPAPDDVRLDRAAPRDHLAFSFGPRTCAGAQLARAELQETVACVLERLPGLAPDLDAPAPRLNGFLLRSFAPLHAVFSPA